MFPKDQLVSLPIDDSTAGVTSSPQINATDPCPSSTTQPILNQNIGNMSKSPAVTVVIVPIYSTQPNQRQQYPAKKDQNGRLVEWSLSHDLKLLRISP
jgi:hypothetical protein